MKRLLKNIILAVVLVGLLVVVINLLLNVGTRHGKEIVVPDFSSMSFDEARQLASRSGVRVYEGDSVFIPNMRRGAVYSQQPYAGSKVKKGRRIMLVTNSRVPLKIVMPNIVGFSMRQAKGELVGKGLRVGRLIYRYDIAANIVMGQQRNGKDIQPGEMVDTGSEIDMVLGSNPENCTTVIPDLTGKDYVRAIDVLQDHYLNPGRVTFDSDIRNYTDSIHAVVYQQSPQPSVGACTMGSRVNLRLTLDQSKLESSGK